MHLIYIDESKDPLNDICTYCALSIPITAWHKAFDDLVLFRKGLKDKYNLPMDFEMHASDFLAGRGKYLFNVINTDDRKKIYSDFVSIAEKFSGAKIITARGYLAENGQFDVFYGLAFCINKMLSKNDSYGILICDEGDNFKLTQMIRKQRDLSRIAEDPVFKKSHDSYFIQLIDFIVHAFLRSVAPVKNKGFLEDVFFSLDSKMFEASVRTDTITKPDK